MNVFISQISNIMGEKLSKGYEFMTITFFLTNLLRVQSFFDIF